MSNLVTLIPAYRSEFLPELLSSLMAQTFRDFRVILADDSPGGEISDLLGSPAYAGVRQALNLTVVPGPRKGAYQNIQHLVELAIAAEDLVHVIMDDDFIYPSFYSEHLRVHQHPGVAVSVSQRWLTTRAGIPAADIALPGTLLGRNDRVLRIGQDELFATTVAHAMNWLGECSNMVFNGAAIRRLPAPPRDRLSYFGLVDIGTILSASELGSVMVIREHLGGFRQHTGQDTQIGNPMIYLAWVAFSLHARQSSKISDSMAMHGILAASRVSLARYQVDPAIRRYFDDVFTSLPNLSEFERSFTELWLEIVREYFPADAENRSSPLSVAA